TAQPDAEKVGLVAPRSFSAGTAKWPQIALRPDELCCLKSARPVRTTFRKRRFPARRASTGSRYNDGSPAPTRPARRAFRSKHFLRKRIYPWASGLRQLRGNNAFFIAS